eukprot:349680-Chlamydomonas_euryale.AAC.2
MERVGRMSQGQVLQIRLGPGVADLVGAGCFGSGWSRLLRIRLCSLLPLSPPLMATAANRASLNP